MRLDAVEGKLQALVPHEQWIRREPARMPAAQRESDGMGLGRELFAAFRRNAAEAEEGAVTWQ